MENNLTRRIKIYCPQHQTVFEIAETSKIVCEIKEHALSNNFPREEFWEFCCDCQTFAPSNLEVGGKAKDACSHCGRDTQSRFVCDDCKTISFDSGEETKAKVFRINFAAKSVQPACAGCLKSFLGADLKLHKCEEAQAIFLTSRGVCPFCKKDVAVAPKNNHSVQHPSEQKTIELRKNEPKTKLLGSICPTCGAVCEINSAFCAKCGQNLKPVTSYEPPPTKAFPVNMPPIPPPYNLPDPVVTVNKNAKPAGISTNTKGCLAVIGLLFAAAGIFSIIAFISKSNNSTVSVTNKNSNSNNFTTTNSVSDSSFNSVNNRSNSSSKTNNNAISNTAENTDNSNYSNKMTPTDSLPNSFNRKYSGSMGGKTLIMQLRRDGNRLEGTAATTRTDYVYGTIDKNGNFDLNGYEDDEAASGTYRGRIKPDGTISGTWRYTNGGYATSFYLKQE